MSKIAVIKTGGKQYLVNEGSNLKVEKITSTANKINFSDVLLVADESGKDVQIGTPKLGVKVEADITKQGRAKKILVVHYKAKVRYHKKQGHRQPFTEVKVAKIS